MESLEGKRSFIEALKTPLTMVQGLISRSRKRSQKTLENPESPKAILEEITNGRLIDTETINSAFKRLGVKIRIPKEIVEEEKESFPKEFAKGQLRIIKRLRRETEGEKAPFIVQIPEKIQINGEEKTLSISVLQELMQKIAEKNEGFKTLDIGTKVPDEIKNKSWESLLSAYSSACIQGSTFRYYNENDESDAYCSDFNNGDNGSQLDLQKEVFGEDCEIEADMIIAITLLYITKGEELMNEEIMRLNTVDSEGNPLYIYTDEQGFHLESSEDDLNSFTGIGACLRISS